MADSTPWRDLPVSDLNLAENCALSARYLASHLTGLDDAPVDIVLEFFQTVTPGRFSSLTDGDVFEWHRHLKDSDDLWDELSASSQFAQCQPDVCAAINRFIPNDLVGIGLLVCLAIELLLVVCYCATSLALYVRKVPGDTRIPRPADLGPLDRVLYAFYSTTTHFFTLATLLSLGISVAVIYDFGAPGTDSFSAPRIRGHYGTQVLLAGGAYFSLAAAVPAFLSSSRRQWLDGAAAVLAWVLASVAISVAPNGFDIRRVDDSLERFCPGSIVPRDIAAVAGQAAHGIATWCPVLFLLVMGVAVACFKCSGGRMWGWRPLRMSIRGLIIIYAVLGFIGACSFIIMTLVFVGRSSWIGESGWGLGQGFALALWMPLLYELVHVAIGTSLPSKLLSDVPVSRVAANGVSVGLDRGLDGRLPKEFVAVRTSDLEPNIELDSAPVMASGPRGPVSGDHGLEGTAAGDPPVVAAGQLEKEGGRRYA